MSLRVPIEQDFSEYQEKIMFGLSLRQFAMVSIALVLDVIIYYSLRRFLGTTLVAILIFVLDFFILASDFIKIEGLPFNRYAKAYLKSKYTQRKFYWKPRIDLDILNEYLEKQQEENKNIKGNQSRQSKKINVKINGKKEELI